MTTTMLDVPGYRVTRMLGCVYGITVRTRNWAAGLGMVIKSMAGGELKWFTNMVCPSLPPPKSVGGFPLVPPFSLPPPASVIHWPQVSRLGTMYGILRNT